MPFLFSVKQLEASGTLDSFSGDFNVPSYRGSTFMDPKVRGERGVPACRRFFFCYLIPPFIHDLTFPCIHGFLYLPSPPPAPHRRLPRMLALARDPPTLLYLPSMGLRRLHRI